MNDSPEFRPQPKPPRGQHKRDREALKRRDVAVERELKKKLLVRDNHKCRRCRVLKGRAIFRLELAHLWQWKRARTREKPPEERHVSQGAMILCLLCHREEESGRLILLPQSDRMADGPVLFVLNGRAEGVG